MFSVDRSKPFVIHSDTNEIEIGGRKIKLSPKETGVLKLLNERSGTTVSRTELLEKVWGDKFANDQGLTQAVSRLRAVLAKNPQITIRTISKKGYMLNRQDYKAMSFGLKPIRINSNMLLIVLLLFSILVLIFIKRIDIRVDKIPQTEEVSGFSESK